MLHPDTELRFISPEVGWGVFATAFIPKGTICWILDPLDQVFSPEEVRPLPRLIKDVLAKYSYRDERGHYVLCWDHSRFVNHSFDSSLISTAYGFELAARDLQPGDELTDDYGYLNVWAPFDCLPEPGTTRTQVLPDDLLHFHAQWDAKAAAAFTRVSQVAQPLAPLIHPSREASVRAVAAGTEPMLSILTCYYRGPTEDVL